MINDYYVMKMIKKLMELSKTKELIIFDDLIINYKDEKVFSISEASSLSEVKEFLCITS